MNNFKHTFFLLLFAFVAQIQAQTPQRTNLPTFYITTTNGQNVSNKETWIPGSITVVSSNASENLTMDLEIRGRGNSTWNLSKKPYRIKLGNKTNLLNMPAKAKNWVLLANHADKTLMRNAVAFKIGEMLGFEYTPPARFVDVVLNGVYIGNYMVTDQIEMGDNRVPVEKLEITDTSMPTIAGGYLVEIDGFADGEPVWFTTSQALKVTVKYPKDDEINAQQLSYVQNLIQSFENALFSQNFTDPGVGYRHLVDTTSLINWYIASELTGDPDCFWSTYIYKKRSNSKLFFGPLWDKDIAFNNCNRVGDVVSQLMRDVAFNPRTWIQRLWQDDWFKSAVNRRWIQFKNGNQLETSLIAYVNELNTLLAASQQQNFTKWNVLNHRVYNEQFLFPTYSGGVDYLKTYISQRINFLTGSFANTQPVLPSQPFVVDNFYYRILNQGSNNAIDVADESLEPNAELYMWSPIQEDSSQLWIIKALRNNEYQLLNLHSGLAMTGNGRGNALIQTLPDTLAAAQRWQITPVLTGNIYGIVNVASGYSVNNSSGNTANGTRVLEYDNAISSAEKTNQHWYIEKTLEIPSVVEPPEPDGTSIYSVSNAVKIYPNPAKDFVRIEFNAPCDATIPVSISSIEGKTLYSTGIEAKNKAYFDINLNQLSLRSGIYLLRVGDGTHKLVVK